MKWYVYVALYISFVFTYENLKQNRPVDRTKSRTDLFSGSNELFLPDQLVFLCIINIISHSLELRLLKENR